MRAVHVSMFRKGISLIVKIVFETETVLVLVRQ